LPGVTLGLVGPTPFGLAGPTPKFPRAGMPDGAAVRRTIAAAESLKCRRRRRRDGLTRDVRGPGCGKDAVVCLSSGVKLEGRRAPGRCRVTSADRGAVVDRRRRPNCRHQTAASRSDDRDVPAAGPRPTQPPCIPTPLNVAARTALIFENLYSP